MALGREGKDRTTIDREHYPASARMAERLATRRGSKRTIDGEKRFSNRCLVGSNILWDFVNSAYVD